jgi:histidine ammonia-lyase
MSNLKQDKLCKSFLFILLKFILWKSIKATDYIVLNGNNLDMHKVEKILNGAKVKIDESLFPKLEKSFLMLFESARRGKPVYGLTVGVGLNKDQQVLNANGELTAEVLAASRLFNINTLRAHSAAVTNGVEWFPTQVTRLSMALRLNGILSSITSVQPGVAELYAEFINNDIIPLVPMVGTVSEGDILLGSHVGLAMIGEWKVLFNKEIRNSDEVMSFVGLKKLMPIGKDALSILSNNAFSVAQAIRSWIESKRLLTLTPLVFALSLEGLNGNVAPFLPQTTKIRPFPYLVEASESILSQLNGSYLWHLSSTRALQDPLSYRTMGYVIASFNQSLEELKTLLNIQINHSDDNPALILESTDEFIDYPQVKQYFILNCTAIFPTSNFNTLPLAIAVQKLNLALVHVSQNSVMRTIRLADERMTHLSRFLATKTNNGHSFGAIQKAFVDLHTRIIHLSAPLSYQGIPIAGDIEDTFTNLNYLTSNLMQIINNIYYIYGLEVFHSAQAIDLRKINQTSLSLGHETSKLYQKYRQKVSFVEKDRPFTIDITVSYNFLKEYLDQMVYQNSSCSNNNTL